VILGVCGLKLKAQVKKGIIRHFPLQPSASSFQPKSQHPHDFDAQAKPAVMDLMRSFAIFTL
jgi:hypothetical protein